MNKINLIPIFNKFIFIHHILLTFLLTYAIYTYTGVKFLLLLYFLSTALVTVLHIIISVIVQDYLDFNVTTITKKGLISNESINDLVLKLHLAEYNNHKLETDSQNLVATTILIGLLYYPVLVVYSINKGILNTSKFIKTFTKLNK